MTSAALRYVRAVVRWHVERRLLAVAVRPDRSEIPLVHVADTVLPGGWLTSDSICYCGGVGEDITLDRYLTEDIGAQVWAFDPTPRSIAYMATAPHDGSRLHFVPVGLWEVETTLRFFGPANPLYVSHSVVEGQSGDSWFDAPCRTIPDVMRELGHERIDLLKLNIEGAEHVVLAAALAAGICPTIITLTYEGPNAFWKALTWTQRLRKEGYLFLARVGWFFTYVYDR